DLLNSFKAAPAENNNASAIHEFVEMDTLLRGLKTELNRHAFHAALVDTARQVSHDIRSPLAALNMVIPTLDGIADSERRIIRNVAQRINDIANGLLVQSKPNVDGNAEPHPQDSATVMLIPLIDALISEKRMQYRERMDLEICADISNGFGLFAQLNASEF